MSAPAAADAYPWVKPLAVAVATLLAGALGAGMNGGPSDEARALVTLAELQAARVAAVEARLLLVEQRRQIP